MSIRTGSEACTESPATRVGQARINGKRKPRGFRLRIADSTLHNTSPYQQREFFPIKIAPLQANDLAGPETETGWRAPIDPARAERT
jgi:hypothetical protein